MILLTGLPLTSGLIAQAIFYAYVPSVTFTLQLIVDALLTIVFIIDCLILNIARRRTRRHFRSAMNKALLSPMQERKQRTMLKKLDLLFLFTGVGTLACVGFVVRLIVYGPTQLELGSEKKVDVDLTKVWVVLVVGVVEMLFLGISAATAADLFEGRVRQSRFILSTLLVFIMQLSSRHI